jgi:DNA mismatch repair protein MutS2
MTQEPRDSGASGRASQLRVPFGRTETDLEWPAVLEALAARCQCEEGAERARRLAPLQSPPQAAARLDEVDEARRLIVAALAPGLAGLTDLSELLVFAARGGTLDGPSLVDVARVAEVSNDVRDALSALPRAVDQDPRGNGVFPRIGGLADALVSASPLVSALRLALDEDGRLLDRASPELSGLRKRVITLRARVKERVESLLKSREWEPLLQDDAFRLREGRFVLPVKVEEQSQVPGIVHGRSGSGMTVFIEPTELVEMNNQAALAQLEVEREEERILQRLSAEVAARADVLEANLRTLLSLDVTLAAGRLARDMDAVRPELLEDVEGTYVLEAPAARHPLLALRERASEGTFRVVANDLRLGRGAAEVIADTAPVLVVSGPNTGGKTVTLKTIGLLALMTRAGLLVPAAEGTRISFFPRIFSDIGDAQSLAEDLSSFSGHVSQINRFLPRVAPGTLVLLDELFSGTDPLQGAALGAALVEDLAERGAVVAVTTHFERLKHFALESPVCASASMGFDLVALAPTFRMELGLPGASYAVGIARRLGFPEAILSRAQRLLSGEDASEVESLLEELTRQKGRLGDRERELLAATAAAEGAQRKFDRELERLRNEALGAVDSELDAIFKEIRDTSVLLKRRRQELTAKGAQAPTEEKLQAVKREIEEVKARLGDRRDAQKREVQRRQRRPLTLDELTAGVEVWVGPFKKLGRILELDAGREQAWVQVGAMKATFKPRDLYTPNEEDVPAEKPALRPASPAESASPAAAALDPELIGGPQTSANTVDLRGMRVDEAVDSLDRFLDTALSRGEGVVFAIHGHGTGALKAAVRDFLRTSAYVTGSRPGERGEGGDGVTVIGIR